MDMNYDTVEAAKRLEELALDRYNSAHSDVQISRITSSSAHYEARETRNSWTLVHQNTNDEMVGAFQGIIQKKDLPPFHNKIRQNSSKHSGHIRFLRQSLSIGGLGTTTFQRVMDAVLDIHTLMARTVGIDNVQECGMLSTIDGSHVCEMSNRYFTPKIFLDVNDEVKLTPDIDPHGYLASAASSMGFYHSADNAVSYFKREGTRDGDYKYIPIQPAIFGIGDIVEVQASFVVFPLKDKKKFKTAMILRSITMLDGGFTQARMARMIKTQIAMPVNVTLKRKTGYGDEIVSGTRTKFQEMEIEEETNAQEKPNNAKNDD